MQTWYEVFKIEKSCDGEIENSETLKAVDDLKEAIQFFKENKEKYASIGEELRIDVLILNEENNKINSYDFTELI